MSFELLAEPVFELSWQRDGATCGVRATGTQPGLPAVSAEELGLAVSRQGDAWRVTVNPSRDLRITEVKATLRLDIASADALYLNGYSSWTDSVEHGPSDRMPGLSKAPGFVVDKWDLDALGDYRFTPEDSRRGHMHGFGYGWLRSGFDVCLIGSLDEDTGFTTLWEDLKGNSLVLSKEAPARTLSAHEKVEVLSFMVCRGSLDQALDAWLAAYQGGLVRRPAQPLVGYSSWYRHYEDIDQDCLLHDLAGVRDELGPQETPGAVKVFQVDDGYTQVGDWQTPDETEFPQGMAPVVEAIVETGFLPGLWMAPFVCSVRSRLFADHKDWLLVDEEGNYVKTGSHWDGQYALDTRNPEVRDYVVASIRKATQEWGFRLLKLDFLYAACMVAHDGMNRGQLMADALDLLRQAAGEDVAFDFCGVPLVSAFGRCEYCRIGCDVGLDWDDKPWMRLLHRERVSTKRSLANTKGRAHLDGRVFANDPDVIFLRPDVKLKDAQRQDLLMSDARLASMLLTSDDMGAWDQGQRAAWARAVEVFCAR